MIKVVSKHCQGQKVTPKCNHLNNGNIFLLFKALLVYDDVIENEEAKDEVNSILSDTNWELPVEELRPVRNQFCELVGVQPPVLLKKPL